jgi:hypothetical protein
VSDTSDATSGGCEDDSDCLMSEHCVQCGPGDTLFLPLACQQLTVEVSTPALSPFAVGGAALAAFLAQALVYLRRRKA